MTSRAISARVSESGRLSIPAEMRREMGIEKGGVVRLILSDDGLHIETTRDFRRRIQALARETGWTEGPSVDDFIAWKREEAQRELAEFGQP
ncbi:MAG: AbrB/MazE/SpoVT family DNA-binding domain-containing protein [Pseudomonadota bacterium]